VNDHLELAGNEIRQSFKQQNHLGEVDAHHVINQIDFLEDMKGAKEKNVKDLVVKYNQEEI